MEVAEGHWSHMISTNVVLMVLAGYTALLAILLFGLWWRHKLMRWAEEEMRWLKKEGTELELMRKFLIEQNTWESRRAYHGNTLMNAQFNSRVDEYNRRRVQHQEVVKKITKLLPW